MSVSSVCVGGAGTCSLKPCTFSPSGARRPSFQPASHFCTGGVETVANRQDPPQDATAATAATPKKTRQPRHLVDVDPQAMGNQKTDDELTDLLTKLYTMQEDVGAKPKTTDQEKKNKAVNIAQESMGRTNKAKKTGSRFLELKSSIVERLQEVQGQMREIKEKENHWGGDNPKEVIRLQAEIRENIRQAQDEWKEIDALYKNEARKKKSKFSPEELELQATLVMRLRQEIEKVKDLQVRGFQRGGASAAAAGLNSQTISAFDSIPAPNVSGGGASSWQQSSGGGVAVTSDQRMQLQQLEERDQDFDQQLDELGEGIQDLAEIARLQGEEVRRQNVMLDNVSNKIDNVSEHVSTVNSRMKETLDEVGRSSDKLCVDIMCIVLAVGFAAVFYNMARG